MAIRKKTTIEDPTDSKYLYILFGIFLITLTSFASYFAYSTFNQYQNSKEAQSQALLSQEAINNYYKDEDLTLSSNITYKAPSKDSALKIPMLMYHYVEYVKDPKDTIRQSLNITPNVFEEQIKSLINAKYTFVTQSEVAQMLGNKLQMPDKPIAFTFDDGYKDFYTVAFPLLKKYNVKSTIYVIIDFLDYPNYMTRAQLKEIADSGLVDVGSHTLNHIYLKTASEKIIENELVESKKKLEVLTGHEVVSFAYPYGAFSDLAKSLVQKTGYTSAVSVIPGTKQSLSNIYFLYRLRPGARTGATLTSWIETMK